jgi:hypothetical protein
MTGRSGRVTNRLGTLPDRPTQPPQMEALADALLGRIPFTGTLPVALEVLA